MIDSIRNDLEFNLKPRQVYIDKLKELEDIGKVDTLHKYNLLNIYRMHVNEHDILKKNLEYLYKLIKYY
jgi:hypothetical protein